MQYIVRELDMRDKGSEITALGKRATGGANNCIVICEFKEKIFCRTNFFAMLGFISDPTFCF